MKKLLEFVQDCNGRLSSKRISGILSILVLLVVFVLGFALDKKIDNNVFFSLCGLAGTLLGVGVLEKFKK